MKKIAQTPPNIDMPPDIGTPSDISMPQDISTPTGIDMPPDIGTTKARPALTTTVEHKFPSVERKEAPTRYLEIDDEPIKAMQQAIINLANKISEHDMADIKAPFTPDKDKEGMYLGGSDAFGKFLVDRYMKTVPTGKQFVTTDLRMPVRTETATEDVSLKNIIATMKRVGKPGQEHEADGDWGPRTNNALKQAAAFGRAMLMLTSDMDLKTSYTQADLDLLNKYIPNDEKRVSQELKEKVAPIIEGELYKISNFYDSFKKFVLEHPQYKEQIEQNQPFYTLKSDLKKMTPYEEKLYEANKLSELTGIQINGVPVHLHHLSDMISFKNFLKTAKINPDDKTSIKKSLDDIMSELGKEGAGF